jgi:hypothetical protein
VNKKEYDPFGLELGTSDPYLQHEEPDYASLSGSSFYKDGGNPFDGIGGCTVDQFQRPCSEAIGMTRKGIAGQCPNNDCGPRHNGQGWGFWNPGTGWKWVDDKGMPLGPADPDTDVIRRNIDDNGLRHRDPFHFFFLDPLSPQKIVQRVSSSQIRCPPTGKELLRNSVVQQAAISNIYRGRPGHDPSRIHETASWIYFNPDNGKIRTVNVPDSQTTLLSTDFDNAPRRV